MVFGALVSPVQSSPNDDQRTRKCDALFMHKKYVVTDSTAYLKCVRNSFLIRTDPLWGPNSLGKQDLIEYYGGFV